MSDLKISETATKAAKHIDDMIVPYLPTMDNTRPCFDNQIQLAINEACRPLVQALELIEMAELPVGYPMPDRFKKVKQALEAHRKEHGE